VSRPGRIFISYRRQDAAWPAGRLYDAMVLLFGTDQVFKGVDGIESGDDDFVAHISAVVGSCDVLLALIGPAWLTASDENGRRRLEDPGDYVRLEIEAALTRNVRVIPVLVDGARMPGADDLPPSLAELAFRNAIELSPAHFDRDTGRLLNVLNRVLAEVRIASGEPRIKIEEMEPAADEPHAICSNCGNPTQAGSEFCQVCGSYLGWDSTKTIPTVAGAPPLTSDRSVAASSAASPAQAAPEPAEPPPLVRYRVTRGGRRRSRFRWPLPRLDRLRRRRRHVFWRRTREMRDASAPSAPFSKPRKPVVWQAYPLVEAPDVVVVEQPFDVVVGIAPRRDRRLIGTGGFSVTNGTVLEVMLTFDPASLRVDGESRFTLEITSDDPDPARILRFTALDGDELVDERRIGVHYLLDGAVVGIAWRLIVAVPTSDDIAGTPVPATRERELLDLSSVLIKDPPDLVLAVYRADTAAAGDYVWSAYPAAAGIIVPDHKRGENIGDPTEFPRSIGAEVAGTGPGQGGALYDFLVGTGRRIGRKVPSAMQWAIRAVAEQPGRTEAASVLLFTEDPYVPWELAAFSAPLHTAFGGDSPFLGAHVAIGRWPLTETRPRPTPARAVEVRGRAVLTARYERVIRWPQLPQAEAEAASIATAYPGTVTIEPLYDKVMNCLRGNPEVDVLHVALHGRFDPAGIDQGLVLLAPHAGGYVAQYLKPQHVESVTMPRPTFVFLNACQVGAGQRVLGDYAGLATAFLSAGASGVVAALWNVHDLAARGVAENFYRALDADTTPVAEVLRRIRAQYTRQYAATDSDGRATTLLAYQLFGHPRLRLKAEPTDGVG
jgi:CHAT domain/TIR domain